ncbi:hypothetical protein BZG36_02428 [Bifiguratus adelaidae]|uniref:Prephenate/arogenate dehydrogenase domain-containing protein n=1 Tax=Bifiguratus adelaidae TaxID=1938954 RepID=A0A261Y3J7_9FUNG|nr:hypothetical protein BZG36_02428 [Bifiguratus adelaidae]
MERDEKDVLEIGIIGMGDMGKLYVRTFLKAGWRNINVCDLPHKYDALCREFQDTSVRVFKDGHGVSRRSDYIIYSVEAEYIDDVVSKFGPSTKVGAIVGGQTSVKEPEIKAFEAHLPKDVHIVSFHSLHGPGVNPKGQPLVMIKHRSSDAMFELAKRVLACLESRFVYLSYKEHDRITADTQAVTHAAFLSNKWHVYAGLAILNPSARIQIHQYAKSVTDLFKLMIQEDKEVFTKRVKEAGEFVFGEKNAHHEPILLSDSILDEFSLSIVPKTERVPNSHLSLLAMVDCWYQLGLNPYEHMVCQTPLFRLWMGITEYLFRSPQMLDEAINAALYSKGIRADDTEFMTAARGWAECVDLGNFEGYRKRFETTAKFFSHRFEESTELGNRMISTIVEKTS